MVTESTSTTGGADDLDLFEAEATGQPVTQSTTIPDKYAGKGVEDLIKMHQNAEKLISRQGQDLAQQRRISDQILDLKKPTTQTTVERKPEVTFEALINNPKEALESAIDNSSVAVRAAAAEQRVTKLEANLAQRTFVANHPAFAEDMADPSFKEWMTKNPVRAALGQAASQENYDAANNLWAMWDEHKELTGTAHKQGEKPKPKVTSTVKTAPAEHRGKPNLSRAKLMELRMKVQAGDPAAVARWSDPGFQERMHQAYAEQRVI